MSDKEKKLQEKSLTMNIVLNAVNPTEEDDEQALPYRSGIPTLRSSTHRVKLDPSMRQHDPKPRNKAGEVTETTWLPASILAEDVFSYDTIEFNLQQAVVSLLQKCDPSVVGFFRTGEAQGGTSLCRLEDFVVPTQSTWRTVNGGQCEGAQKYLSDMIESDTYFLEQVDRFITAVVLPYIKRRLLSSLPADHEFSGRPVTFYYQRPPTLRLQPGPARAKVKEHKDSEYGHQNGEINFWIPLTDRNLTGVDLWCESSMNKGDHHPVVAQPGEVIAFHGSSCGHYVNINKTSYTRVSMDFRVGVEGYFDPTWCMRGTTDDHGRREVSL